MEALFNLNKEKKDGSKDKSQVKQAENIWAMLDEMALTNPDSYKQFIEKTINEGKEAMKPPEPHMCVKTKLTKPKPGPLFINVFSWQKVGAPDSDDDPIPVFGSKLEFDKTNGVVNLVFNPEILEKYGKEAKNKLEQEMLINLALQYTEEQNPEVKVNSNKFDILKETLFYGNLEYQISKLTNRKYKPGMSDLDMAKEALGDTESAIPTSILNKLGNLGNIGDQTSESCNKTIKTKNLIEEVNPTNLPSYQEKIVQSKEDSGKTVFELRINLPKVESMKECELDIDADCITLNVKDNIYDSLKVSLTTIKNDYTFSVNEIEAKFIKKVSVLRVKIPLKIK